MAEPIVESGGILLWQWAAANGVWAPHGSDLRTPLSTVDLVAGQGLLISSKSNQTIISLDSAVAPQVWQAERTLDFGAIPNLSCTAGQSIQLPGALPNEPVIPGWPHNLANGVIGQMKVVSVNTVSVSLCNLSGGNVTVGALSYSAAVMRNFY